MDPSSRRPPAPVVIHRTARPDSRLPPPAPAWRKWWHGSLQLIGGSIAILVLCLIIESSVLPGSALAVLATLAALASTVILILSPAILLLTGLIIACQGAPLRGLFLITPAAIILYLLPATH